MKTIKKSGITFMSVIFITALTSVYSTSLQAQVRQYTNPGLGACLLFRSAILLYSGYRNIL
jgi:hypothetical protein